MTQEQGFIFRREVPLLEATFNQAVEAAPIAQSHEQEALDWLKAILPQSVIDTKMSDDYVKNKIWSFALDVSAGQSAAHFVQSCYLWPFNQATWDAMAQELCGVRGDVDYSIINDLAPDDAMLLGSGEPALADKKRPDTLYAFKQEAKLLYRTLTNNLFYPVAHLVDDGDERHKAAAWLGQAGVTDTTIDAKAKNHDPLVAVEYFDHGDNGQRFDGMAAVHDLYTWPLSSYWLELVSGSDTGQWSFDAASPKNPNFCALPNDPAPAEVSLRDRRLAHERSKSTPSHSTPNGFFG